ncbi:MAG: dTMP kinase [Acidimicrobiales bacterium]
MPERGRLIALEGGEAAGKTLQSRLLADQIGAVLTREPGGTELGERIRDLVLDARFTELSSRSEALLMAAARAEHVHAVVEPALAAGQWVVTDRFIASSLAYQGYGRGLDVEELARLSLWAGLGLIPDLNVLVDVPASVAAARRAAIPDRLEAAGEDFHHRVAQGFHALARADQDRWVVVDGVGEPDVVAQRVMAAVTGRLGRPRR